MNKYCYKILKHIAKPSVDCSREKFYQMYCPSVAEMSLEYLIGKGYIFHTDVAYELPEGKEVEVDCFGITMEGLSYLQDKKSNDCKFWIPIIISNIMSFGALVVSIITSIIALN